MQSPVIFLSNYIITTCLAFPELRIVTTVHNIGILATAYAPCSRYNSANKVEKPVIFCLGLFGHSVCI